MQKQASWAEREAHIERWRRSGLKAEQYCTEQGLALPTFHYWVKRLRQQARQVAGTLPIAPRQWVPIAIEATPAPGKGLALYSPGGWQVNLPAAWSIEQLLTVLRQLP